MITRALKYTCLLWLSCCIIPQWLEGQTQLNPGDLLIIAVSSNVGNCGFDNSEDLITFISFQDIETGTPIDFTDNGWERGNIGRWGNTEGTVRMTRTGPPIPAGTPIQIKLPVQFDGLYEAILPDNGWTFDRLSSSFAPVNLASDGDQLYFMQGGTWINGTIGGHDARYVGGTILYGFNMKDFWQSLARTTEDSGLHPDVTPCFFVNSDGPVWAHAAYDGDLSAATQLEWSQRLRESSNWEAFPGCFSTTPPFFPSLILPNSISLACTTCSGCSPLDAELFFNLPANGFFGITFTNGNDTITQAGITDGSSIIEPINVTTTYTLLEVEQNGCSVQSDLGPPVTFTIGAQSSPLDSLVIDTCIIFPATYNLTTLEDTLTGGATDTLIWYQDFQLTQPIPDPANFPVTGVDTLFATLGDPACPSPAVPVFLNANAQPVANALDLNFCAIPGEPTLVDLPSLTPQISPGLQGELIFYTAGDAGGVELPDNFFYVGPNYDTEVIAVADNGCVSDTTPVTFLTNRAPDPANFSLQVTPSQGCLPLDIQLQLNAPQAGTYIIDFLLNDSLVQDQVITAPGIVTTTLTDSTSLVLVSVETVNGCSSDFRNPDTIQINVVPNAELALDQPLVACQGGPVDLNDGVQLVSGPDPNTDLTFHTALPPTPANALTSPIVDITRDTVFYAFAISLFGCSDTLEVPVLVDQNPIQITTDPLDVFNGFTVSCADGTNGSISASISGGIPPFDISWSNGAAGDLISDLPPGEYTVTVTDNSGCTASDTATATAPLPIVANYSVPPQTCDANGGTNIILDSLSGGIAPFFWSINGVSFAPVGATPFVLQALPSGQQQLTIRDQNGCIRVDTVTIPDPVDGLTLTAPGQVTIFSDEQALIEVQANFTPTAVSWSPTEGLSDSTGLTVLAAPSTSTVYTVSVLSPEGCLLTRDIRVEVRQAQRVFMPNAFSPNADGANDFYFPLTEPSNFILSFEIYDRWGELIYQRENVAPPGDTSFGWDGTYRGQLMPPGTYIYVVNVQFPDDSTDQRQGEFTLMR